MTQLVDEAVDALKRRVFVDQLSVGTTRCATMQRVGGIELERGAGRGVLRDRSG